jgi:hydroxymethylglutaryl-CoA reductase (NADPH)
MANNYKRIKSHLDVYNKKNKSEMKERLMPKQHLAHPQHVHQGNRWEDVLDRWKQLDVPDNMMNYLLDEYNLDDNEKVPYRIENFIGTVKVPLGLAGPLLINGANAQGLYYIPLATLEPTMIASYSRGAQCITRAGGCATLLLDESVSRTPGFKFNTIMAASEFLHWITNNYDNLKIEAEKTTKHGKLIDMKASMCGNQVFLYFEYSTGDAIGQNMVTIATQAIIDYIMHACPIKPAFFTIEANLSGDKKASIHTFQSVRGRKVTVEVIIPGEITLEMLNSTPEQMVDLYRMNVSGAFLSGIIGMQGHIANGLAALYIACGQDAACVSESSTGILNMEVVENGALYASLTMPNIMVGTIGWATELPSQKACLKILGLHGPHMAKSFAELCAALCLAGELSICAALSVGEFTQAHERLARGVTK